MTKVVAPLLFLGISLGLFFTYTKPAIEVLQAYRGLEERVDKALMSSKELQTKTQDLHDRYKGFTRDEMQRIEAALPNTLDTIHLIVAMDSLAGKSNITITRFELPRADEPVVQPTMVDANGNVVPAPEDPLGKATFKVTCEGSYQNFKSFVAALERSLTLLDIERMKISSQVAEDGTSKLEYSFDVKTYWLK